MTVTHLITHILDKPPHERSSQMRKVLATQVWAQAGGWQVMSGSDAYKYHLLIETSAGPHEPTKLRCPHHFTTNTDLRSLYWRPHQSLVMPAAGDIV